MTFQWRRVSVGGISLKKLLLVLKNEERDSLQIWQNPLKYL